MKLSTGLVANLMGKSGMQQALSNCVIDIYSGTMPTIPNDVPNGTRLVSITLGGATHTAETRSYGTMTLTGGAAGSVNTVTVNGIDVLGTAVNFNTTTAQTATDVAAQINKNPQNTLVTAEAAGSVITLTAVPGLGALPNTWVVAATLTTITASYAAFASGVTALNGLQWMNPAQSATTLQCDKPVSASWQGTATATGTAGWFRIRAANDDGMVSSVLAARIDGSIGTTGADMNLPSLSIVSGSPVSVPSGSLSLPQS